MTVLLWGNHWWLPHHKLPVPFTDLSLAADQLAAAWPDQSRQIRIIYQPDEFATVPVACPNGNRHTLALALAEEHPVVRHPGHVWSYEPIVVSGESFATLLHYETEPALFGLVHRLREHKFAVKAVWPMATWLNALPPELSPSGAMTVCAIQPDRFCLYRHSADGNRAVRVGHDGDSLTAVSAHLSQLPNQAETEYILFVTTDDTLVERLTEQIQLDDKQIVGISLLHNALAKPATLGTRHPAQLLPPVPMITAPKLISLVTLLCLLAALGMSASPLRALVSRFADHESIQQEKQTLRTEIAQLKENEKKLLHWQSLADSQGADPLPWVQLLQSLTVDFPEEIVLTRLRADRSGFKIEGGVIEKIADEEWSKWQQSLQLKDARWSWENDTAPPTQKAFTLKGQWQ